MENGARLRELTPLQGTILGRCDSNSGAHGSHQPLGDRRRCVWSLPRQKFSLQYHGYWAAVEFVLDPRYFSTAIVCTGVRYAGPGRPGTGPGTVSFFTLFSI